MSVKSIYRSNKQEGFKLTVLVRGRKITIEDKLAECARKHFIDLDEEDCEIIINAMLTPNLKDLGHIDLNYEYSIKTEKELSGLLTEGIIKELKVFKGYDYVK